MPADGATDAAATDTAATDAATTEEPAADAATDTAATDAATTEEPAADAATDTAAVEEQPVEGATDMAATEEPAADAATDVVATDPAMTEGAIAREGYTAAEAKDLTTEMLTGARVYGSADEDVGEVSELILTDAGEITNAVIDVGGFLGIGEKSVSVPLEELNILHENEGSDVRVYINMTQEELEALPKWEG
jgi:hypothetical protein